MSPLTLVLAAVMAIVASVAQQVLIRFGLSSFETAVLFDLTFIVFLLIMMNK